MYLNIILTLIFLTLSLIAWASITGKKYQIEEHEKAKDRQRELNDYMVMLHEEMIRELKRINGGRE